MLIRHLLTALALPPALNFVLIGLGLLLGLRYRRLGRVLVGLGLVSLFLLSLPWVKMKVYEHLESMPALDPAMLTTLEPAPQAIVLMGGGMMRFADEYRHVRLTDGSVRRIQYAAFVAEQTGLPVLITGGGRFEQWPEEIESERMGALLRQLGQEPRWLERQSTTTWENAQYSAPVLKEAGIDRVLLVTDAWHMRRSVLSFEAQGIQVIPAPTAFRNGAYEDFRSFIPGRYSLMEVGDALHEWLGILTYRIMYSDVIAAAQAQRH